MQRRNQLNPMRSLILLAVTWVAGSLLFAAEQTQKSSPATQTVAATNAAPPAAEAQPAPVTEDAADGDAKGPAADQDSEEDETAPAQENADTAASPSQKSESSQNASAADKGSPRRFVPSEQVRADFDVSFPIDI